MKSIVAKLRPIFPIVLSLIIVTVNRDLSGFGCKTIVIPRSPAINAARQLVGWQDQINLSDQCANYGSININAEYMRSKDSCEIARYLLGSRSVVFSGSLAEDRGENEILADYFGLPLDYKSTVCFDPFMSNFLVEFDLYLGLDCLTPGLYATVNVPIGHDTWGLDMLEAVCFAGTATTPAGYMSSSDIVRADLPTNVTDVFEGKTTFGDLTEPLKYGKIFGRESATHFSDIQLAIGYNFFATECYHLGLNARLYIPSSNCVDPEFLFNPIVGDGRHWQAGIGFSGHTDLWSDCCVTGSLYMDGNFTHLFPVHQLRPYDLRNGPGSRYMLLENFGLGSSHLFINGEAAPNQYTGNLVPAINKTTLCSKIRVDIQADIAIKLALRWEDITLDIGYGLWARSKEILMCRRKFPHAAYGIKGDAQIYGFTDDDQPIPINATQHEATIHAGQGDGNFKTGTQLQNLSIDNPAGAEGPTAGVALFNITNADAAFFGYARVQALTSNPTILLTDADINECSALAPRGLSQKFFAHLGTAWYTDNFDDYVPFMGVGGEIEWSTGSKSNSALSQWGVWIKGGLSF